MTGPEHYREAEKHLAYAKSADFDSDSERYNLGAAQVHATLALAAATALNDAHEGMRLEDHHAWRMTVSVNVPTGGEDDDDSEALRQEAEDDARDERLIEDDGEFVLDPEHDPATCRECLDACTNCGSLNHHANDCEAEL